MNNEPWRAEALIECTSKGNVVYEENGRPKMRPAFPKIRIENMSRRYMIKMFLIDLYVHWCVLEGIPVKTPYCEEKLGLQAKLHTIGSMIKNPKMYEWFTYIGILKRFRPVFCTMSIF